MPNELIEWDSLSIEHLDGAELTEAPGRPRHAAPNLFMAAE
jgi:hypothetical protein